MRGGARAVPDEHRSPAARSPAGHRRPARAAYTASTAEARQGRIEETATPEQPERPASPEGDGVRPDRGAFSDLYEAHAPRVYRYLLSRTSNPSDAEELTSRTFVQALAGLDQYRGRGAGFPAWLMSIAHNLLVNWYRDRGRRPPTEALDAALQVPASTPGPEASLEQNESIARVRAAISALAPERQQLISLKYVDGLSNAEIGRIMARTEGAVKALHHRTLRELQQLLGEEERGISQRTSPPSGLPRGTRGGSRR